MGAPTPRRDSVIRYRNEDNEAPWPECDNHIEVQHRDRRPPWCRSCGWNRGRPSVPATHIKEIRNEQQ